MLRAMSVAAVLAKRLDQASANPVIASLLDTVLAPRATRRETRKEVLSTPRGHAARADARCSSP